MADKRNEEVENLPSRQQPASVPSSSVHNDQAQFRLEAGSQIAASHPVSRPQRTRRSHDYHRQPYTLSSRRIQGRPGHQHAPAHALSGQWATQPTQPTVSAQAPWDQAQFGQQAPQVPTNPFNQIEFSPDPGLPLDFFQMSQYALAQGQQALSGLVGQQHQQHPPLPLPASVANQYNVYGSRPNDMAWPGPEQPAPPGWLSMNITYGSNSQQHPPAPVPSGSFFQGSPLSDLFSGPSYSPFSVFPLQPGPSERRLPIPSYGYLPPAAASAAAAQPSQNQHPDAFWGLSTPAHNLRLEDGGQQQGQQDLNPQGLVGQHGFNQEGKSHLGPEHNGALGSSSSPPEAETEPGEQSLQPNETAEIWARVEAIHEGLLARTQPRGIYGLRHCAMMRLLQLKPQQIRCLLQRLSDVVLQTLH